MNHIQKRKENVSVGIATRQRRRSRLCVVAMPIGGRRRTTVERHKDVDANPHKADTGPFGRLRTSRGKDVSATSKLKPVRMYSVAGRLRKTNAIYENELSFLLQRRKVLQLVIFVNSDGYSVAVLSKHRADAIEKRYTREGDKVLRLRPVQIEHEGFAPLYSVRSREVHQYRSLDTLINSLKACGPLPPIYVRQGAKK